MKRLSRGTNITVFLAFFGIALVEATQAGHWLSVLFWLAIGSFFLGADRLQHHPRH